MYTPTSRFPNRKNAPTDSLKSWWVHPSPLWKTNRLFHPADTKAPAPAGAFFVQPQDGGMLSVSAGQSRFFLPQRLRRAGTTDARTPVIQQVQPRLAKHGTRVRRTISGQASPCLSNPNAQTAHATAHPLHIPLSDSDLDGRHRPVHRRAGGGRRHTSFRRPAARTGQLCAGYGG